MADGKHPRIGVYICHCGGNISDYVDVKKVAEDIAKEDNVVVAKDVIFACSDSSQNEMVEDVKANKLDRLIVASCSPRLHEITFRNVSQRAGLNPYTYYHVNIREQSSWAHTDDREGATEKALRQVRSAVAYSRLSEPLEGIKAQSTPAVMVVGGGIAGLRAAIDLADAGITVHLVEKEPFLGGRVPQLSRVYPRGESGPEIVRRLVHEAVSEQNIAVHTNSEIDSVEGYVGNFEVKINSKPRYFKATCPEIASVAKVAKHELPNAFDYGLTKRGGIIPPPYEGAYPAIPCLDKEHCPPECLSQIGAICGTDALDLEEKSETIRIKVGSIIVATGFDPYEPKLGEFGYGLYKNVVTLQQLHRSIDLGTLNSVRDIAFIYCVGSRQTSTKEDENVHTYCSRYCCNATMNVSLSLLSKMKGLHIYHIYRDIRTYGLNELLYEQASKDGVIFLNYAQENPPTVSEQNGKLAVKVKDLLTPIGEELELPVDMVVLVTGMVPRSNDKLYSMLKISKGKDKFLLEIHPKLRPVETAIAGIYIAGTAQAPRDILETLASAEAAASKAANVVSKKELILEPFVAHVNPEKCSLNKQCIQECKYDSIEIKENAGIQKAWVNVARCTGCGACIAVCPTGAIELKGLANEQIKAMIKAMARSS